ncbi:MAG: dihydrolipoamide acetyltransferase family protein [Anaerolineaceae bacterium]|nr:dihydrolipoamide acetyltransferase family protein [Anaerolineaceae bacterium]
MSDVIKMPKLGFDMAEGTLVHWLKKEGEPVERGEIVAEIETDKATVEVESGYAGTICRLLVDEGTTLPVGKPIAIILKPGEEVCELPVDELEESAREAAKKGVPQEEIKVVPAEKQAQQQAEDDELLRASPLAKRMARDFGLDLREVAGSGPRGRVVKKDVRAAIERRKDEEEGGEEVDAPRKQKKPAASAVKMPLPDWGGGEPPADKEVPLTKLRGAIGRRMAESKQQVPHFYVAHEYDVEKLLSVRKELNALLPAEQKLSVNDFVVKATALALRQFPNLNASLDEDKVIQHGQVNIGVAVAVEGGLLTVVSRDTDRKPLRLISSELKTMVERTRDGKVRPDDIEGSTFSISNLGMFEVSEFSAIINPPEAAILAVGTARQQPVVKDGELAVGTRMKMVISVDHRISDGVEAAQFMQALADYIEEPLRLVV